jgi:hypothetical protein
MADRTDYRICANEVCNCPAAENSDYCGPTCNAAVEADVVEITCDCGHPGCAGEVAVQATV